jgi:hypothetical protein
MKSSSGAKRHESVVITQDAEEGNLRKLAEFDYFFS